MGVLNSRALSPRYVPLGESVSLIVPLTSTLSKNAQHEVGKGRVFLTVFANSF